MQLSPVPSKPPSRRGRRQRCRGAVAEVHWKRRSWSKVSWHVQSTRARCDVCPTATAWQSPMAMVAKHGTKRDSLPSAGEKQAQRGKSRCASKASCVERTAVHNQAILLKGFRNTEDAGSPAGAVQFFQQNKFAGLVSPNSDTRHGLLAPRQVAGAGDGPFEDLADLRVEIGRGIKGRRRPEGQAGSFNNMLNLEGGPSEDLRVRCPQPASARSLAGLYNLQRLGHQPPSQCSQPWPRFDPCALHRRDPLHSNPKLVHASAQERSGASYAQLRVSKKKGRTFQLDLEAARDERTYYPGSLHEDMIGRKT